MKGKKFMAKNDIQMLGLGSIVKAEIEEMPKGALCVVLARGLMPAADGYSVRYRVARHPFGDVKEQITVTIRETQITEVIFEGYKDSADDIFVENLVAQIEKTPQKPIPTSSSASASQGATGGTTVQEPQEEKEILPVAENPFDKFR
jgi:hypothetical protein